MEEGTSRSQGKLEFSYFDDEDQKRGPYSEEQMYEWHRLGYLTSERIIEIRPAGVKKTLGTLLTENGPTTPFHCPDPLLESSIRLEEEIKILMKALDTIYTEKREAEDSIGIQLENITQKESHWRNVLANSETQLQEARMTIAKNEENDTKQLGQIQDCQAEIKRLITENSTLKEELQKAHDERAGFQNCIEDQIEEVERIEQSWKSKVEKMTVELNSSRELEVENQKLGNRLKDYEDREKSEKTQCQEETNKQKKDERCKDNKIKELTKKLKTAEAKIRALTSEAEMDKSIIENYKMTPKTTDKESESTKQKLKIAEKTLERMYSKYQHLVKLAEENELQVIGLGSAVESYRAQIGDYKVHSEELIREVKTTSQNLVDARLEANIHKQKFLVSVNNLEISQLLWERERCYLEAEWMIPILGKRYALRCFERLAYPINFDLDPRPPSTVGPIADDWISDRKLRRKLIIQTAKLVCPDLKLPNEEEETFFSFLFAF